MASSARRDLGLERIGTTTRLLAVGAMVVGGVLSAAVAKALPGTSTHRANPPGTSSGTQAPTAPSGDQNSTSSLGSVPPLTAPAQAPQPTTAPPLVSSGGS
jgi:hypothetical protein